MELATLRAEGLLDRESWSLPNPARVQRNSFLKAAWTFGLFGAIALLLSRMSEPFCPNKTPRKTTLGAMCSYQWTATSTCNAYCCDRHGFGESESLGDWCRACIDPLDGTTCFIDRCAPAQTQMEYVLDQLFNGVPFMIHMLVLILGWLLMEYLLWKVSRPRRAKGWMLVREALRRALLLALVAEFMYLLYGYYLFTDCHQRFRGVSDILFLLALLSLGTCTLALVSAHLRQRLVPKFDEFLQLVTENRERGDEHVLVLHVGRDCLHSFYQQQLEEVETGSMEVDQVPSSLKFIRFTGIQSFLAVLVVAYFGIFSQRLTVFFCVSQLMNVAYLCSFYVRRRPRVQRWFKQRDIKGKMAKLPQQDTVVLFHNTRAPGEGVQADDCDPRFRSGAFFEDQRQSVFLPHVSTQESLIENVFATTRIVEIASTWQLRFSVHDMPVPLSFPLEPRDVPRAERWLENHEIFHFENE